MRHVTLICGAPCSGKTTLARRLAQPGDLILDLDVIAQQLGSPQRWRHDPATVQAAEECMTQVLRKLARTDHITAYVIRSLPHPARRAQLARAIRADVVYVLAPPMTEVLARAKRDGRPAGTATTIRQWYRQYRPSEVERHAHPSAPPMPGLPAAHHQHALPRLRRTQAADNRPAPRQPARPRI